MSPLSRQKPDEVLGWSLLESMLRIRLVEESIASRYAEQRMRCPVHLSVGQEACAAGVCAALDASDQVMSSHRSHAHYLAKGGALGPMIAELHGKVTGCTQGRGGSMHLLDLKAGFAGAVPIVGSTIPIATGLAFADSRLKRRRVTVAFFGEGATEEGVFHESLNFARLHRLPILYVCENNLYSVYSPLSVRQPEGRTVSDLAAGHDLPTFTCDGNQALEVHALASKARQLCLDGQGPVFLELPTYRWREHCGPGYDNNIGYREEAEFLAWKAKDPIPRLESVLRAAGLLDESRLSGLRASLQREIDQAFADALAASFPEVATLHQHLFA